MLSIREVHGFDLGRPRRCRLDPPVPARNRLSYEKLHKLVYSRYNLRLRIKEHEIKREERLLDPCSMIMEATLYNDEKPMMDGLSRSMSQAEPLLDEGDQPAQVIVEEIEKEEQNLKRKQRMPEGKEMNKIIWLSKLTRVSTIKQRLSLKVLLVLELGTSWFGDSSYLNMKRKCCVVLTTTVR